MHLKRFFNKIPRAKIYLEPFTLFILFFKVIFKKPRKRSKTKEWENIFKKYFGKKEAIALPKARIAFYFLLKNLDLPKNSEIIITPLTIADMVNAIVWAGHEPVFCDLGDKTYNIDYKDLEKKITPKTKVVLITHLNGFATNMDKVLTITQRHDLHLIEDASQAFGATFNNKLLGTFGTAGIFSISFLKTCSTLSGGMLILNNSNLAEKIKEQIKNLPLSSRKILLKDILKNIVLLKATNKIVFSLFTYYVIKFSEKLNLNIVNKFIKSNSTPKLTNIPDKSLLYSYTDLQSELGLKIIKKTKSSDEKRIQNAKILTENLSKKSKTHIPVLLKNSRNIFWRFPVSVDNPKKFQKFLFKNYVDSASTNLILATNEPTFEKFSTPTPNANKVHKAMFLPIHSSFKKKDMIHMAKIVNKYFENKPIAKNTDVLLVHPPVNTEKTLGKIKKLNPTTPPTSLACLAAYLKENNIKTSVLDAFKDSLSAEKTAKKILERNPKIIGLSVSTPGVPVAHEVARLVKKENEKIKIIFGGAHPTLMPKETLSDNNVDFVVRGEGEETLLELVQKIDTNSKNFSKIKSISYNQNEKYQENPPREIIKDINTLPIPAWEMFNLKSYTPSPHWDMGRPFISLPVLRGCPHSCTFCCLPMGKTPRMLTPKRTVEYIEHAVNNLGVKTIMINPLFPGGKWAEDFCNLLIQKGLNKKFSWMPEVRVDYVNLDLLKLMKKAGCRRVAYGIESGSQKLLDNIKKGVTLEQIEKAVKLTKKARIEVIAFFILGLPGETKELTQQTINFAKKLNPDYVKFNLAVPYPGTEMYEDATKEGLLKSLDWERFTSFSSMGIYEPIYIPKGMVGSDLVKFQKKALRQFYFRPSYIFKRLLRMRRKDEFARNIRAALILFGGTK